ncbi:MAG: DUF4244 domain-containing protein [Propionibacteriaceae bacterium]|nr:DUF4244 domain-containing protein [Propionibacteriaceae bacterium]
MSALIPVRRSSRSTRPARRLAERGLTTVEYAIGLLGAAAAALLLLRIFHDNALFDTMMKWVTDIFVQAAAHD